MAQHLLELLAVAEALAVRTQLDEARRVARCVCALAEQLNEPLWVARAHAFVGRLAQLEARFDEAIASINAAMHWATRAGQPVECQRLTLVMAFLHYDKGDAGQATALLDRVVAEAAMAPDPTVHRLLRGYRGNLARQAGAWAEACTHYDAAITLARDAGDGIFESVFLMDKGVVQLLAGAYGEACIALSQAETLALRLPPSLARFQAVALSRHYLALAHLILGNAQQQPPETLPSLRALSACFGGRPSLRRLQQLRPSTEHGRLSKRLLLRATEVAQHQPARIVVAMDGSRFVVGTELVDLLRRHALRRLLAVIAQATASKPATAPMLIAAAWPSERLLPASARNRLHVALNTLRRLGLGQALCSDGGYYLDPARISLNGTS